MMYEAVLICVSDNGKNSFRTSGVSFCENFVLTTGTILSTVLQEDKELEDLLTPISKSSVLIKVPVHLKKIEFSILREPKNKSDVTIGSKNKKFVSVKSNVVAFWKCPLVSSSVERLFHDWTLSHGATKNESSSESIDNIDLNKVLMSALVILKYEDKAERYLAADESHNIIPALAELSKTLVRPYRGDVIEIISTPFGNELFLNSLSSGIISNVVGSEGCIILTDARTVAGCEGGPIFTVQNSGTENVKNKLTGLVTCSLSWRRGEWVGLTVGISLTPILKKILQSHFSSFTLSDSNLRNSDSAYLKFVDEVVVLVRCNSSWGSGVVLDTRRVITCSHVLQSGENIFVYYKNEHHPATVVYRTRDGFPYDLAIIQTSKDIFKKSIKLCDKAPKLGDEVVAAGFPFFTEEEDLRVRPSLVRGCISRIYPHMIQTTCCIQSGFSGGALLRDKQLLGIVVSNARDSADGALYPHINFVIPSSTFLNAVYRFLKTNNSEHLKDLENLSPEVLALWSLQSSKL